MVFGGAGARHGQLGLDLKRPGICIPPPRALGQQRGLKRLGIVRQGAGTADHGAHGSAKPGRRLLKSTAPASFGSDGPEGVARAPPVDPVQHLGKLCS